MHLASSSKPLNHVSRQANSPAGGLAPPTEEGWRTAAILVGLTALAFGLRMAAIGHSPFWFDEYATYVFATSPLGDLLGERMRYELNPPGYYLVQKLWFVFGDSRTAMRSLPALFGALTVPIVFAIALRLANRKTALFSAMLFVTTPVHVHFAREIRCYSMLTFFACSAIAATLWLLPGPPAGRRQPSSETEPAERAARRAWLASVITLSVSAALLLHNTAALLPVLLVIYASFGVLGGTGTSKAEARRDAWRVVFTCALGALPFLWWLPKLWAQLFGDLGSTMAWIPEPTPSGVYHEMTSLYPYLWAKPLVYALALFGLWRARSSPRVLVFFLLFLVGQPVMLLLASQVQPMFLLRSLVWPSALFSILLAIALATTRRAWLAGLTVAAISVLQLWMSVEYVVGESRRADELERVANLIDAKAGDGDAIFACPKSYAWQLAYLLRESPARDLPRYAANYGRGGPEQLDAWIPARAVAPRDLGSIAARHKVLWVVFKRRSRLEPMIDMFVAAGWSAEQHDLGAAQLVRLQQPDRGRAGRSSR